VRLPPSPKDWLNRRDCFTFNDSLCEITAHCLTPSVTSRQAPQTVRTVSTTSREPYANRVKSGRARAQEGGDCTSTLNSTGTRGLTSSGAAAGLRTSKRVVAGSTPAGRANVPMLAHVVDDLITSSRSSLKFAAASDT
jgi:hypothetical protein